jgi:CRP/FNR family transcriptional regulator, polysaccharide utilization system transcription regulator
MDCVLPTFDVLKEDQIKRINENSYLVTHKKGEDIFRQNKPISYIKFIKSGLVKISREGANEKSVIIKIASTGSFLDLLSLFYENRYQYSATSIEDTNITYTSFSVFKEILSENGTYAICLMNLLCAEAKLLMDKVINVSQKQVTGRLADVLLFFSKNIYQSNTYTLPVSRMELAELISSTKESISRVLTEFKNDKIIDIDDKNITIKSPELLQILSKLG